VKPFIWKGKEKEERERDGRNGTTAQNRM